jgi:hypothetical protein
MLRALLRCCVSIALRECMDFYYLINFIQIQLKEKEKEGRLLQGSV